MAVCKGFEAFHIRNTWEERDGGRLKEDGGILGGGGKSDKKKKQLMALT